MIYLPFTLAHQVFVHSSSCITLLLQWSRVATCNFFWNHPVWSYCSVCWLPFIISICNASRCLVSPNLFSSWFILSGIVSMLSITMLVTSPVLHSTWSSSCSINFLYFATFSFSRWRRYSFEIHIDRLLPLLWSVSCRPRLFCLVVLIHVHFSMFVQPTSSHWC